MVDKVIPQEKTITLPTEAPIKAPTLPTLQKLGTISPLALDKDQMTVDENDKLKMDGKDELKRCEDIGEMDLWSEKQSTLPPKIDKMKYLTIETTFEYPGVDGSKCMDWYWGNIIKVMNETKYSVKIEWDESTLAGSDVQFSVHKLMSGNWNPKKIRKGGWREYIA